MIWYALILPLLISGVGIVFYRHKFTWWEVFVPTLASLIVILISYFTMKSITLYDVEYKGYLAVEARYYEAWETYVHRTCTRTVSCGKNCTTVQTYDCSYCDEHKEHWTLIDSGGNEIEISEEKYNQLVRKWGAEPQFVELNRDIDFSGSCGKDGDMYFVKWDEKIITSETTTFEESFTNILKCNHSAFNFPVINPTQAKKEQLYDYPKLDYYVQHSTLGLDSLKLSTAAKNRLRITLDYLNGELGAKNKVRVFTLFFKDKDIKTAFLQEAYWDGGNQNEIVVCIGLDKQGNMQWVKPFSWTDSKRVLVDIREDLMEAGKINEKEMYDIYKTAIEKSWKYKSFKDFNYLSFEPTTGQLIFVYVLTVFISIGAVVWCVKNEIEN